jgi:hypothetical protein
VITLSKKQTLAVFAVVFATAMIVGSIASSSDNNMAFATNKKAKNAQAQTNTNQQALVCQSSGGISLGSGNGLLAGIGIGLSPNAGINLCSNTNTNNNAESGPQAATTN